MRKKGILTERILFMAATGIVFIAMSGSVLAQTTSEIPVALPQSQTPPVNPQKQNDGKTDDARQFDEHKQNMLKNISDHIARMQQKQSCIQAATDEKTLSICLSGEKNNAPQDDKKQPAQQSPVQH